MGQNANLQRAKAAKDDEFYTQYWDIQVEVNAYIDYNPDVFRGKTILLPCDDPEWSNFTRFFAENFELFGIKKLISTSFAVESKNYAMNWQPTLFETENPKYQADKSRVCGKIFVLDEDTNNSGRIDFDDLRWEYLEGNGDFRSEEVCKLRDEADIIITNPPFSLFREFLAWIMKANKQFLILGNKGSVTYKEVFPLIQNNKVWMGPSITSGDREFRVPKDYETRSPSLRYDDEGNKYIRVPGVHWFTNIEHGFRHKPLQLMTMEENIEFNEKYLPNGYERYDNYDAIEVPVSKLIPKDYPGVMGVPITFLDKYCPEQFEIVGITKTWYGGACKTYPDQIQIDKSGKSSKVSKLNDGPAIKVEDVTDFSTYYQVDGNNYIQTYARILIRHKNPQI